MQEAAIEVRVTGRVHGVGYRFFVKEAAEALGLKGWVQNVHDGSVEALIVGPQDAAQQLLEALKEGPPAAIVADVTSSPTTTDEELDGFHIVS